jgi:hypothetical protein
MDRTAAIELGAEVVKSLADSLLSWGQSPNVERDDLISVGVERAIKTIDNYLAAGGRTATGSYLPLNKAIARHAKTYMLRFIASEKRESRYQSGRDADGCVIPRRKMPASIWMGVDEHGFYFPEHHKRFEYPADAVEFCTKPVLDCTLPGEWLYRNQALLYTGPQAPRDNWGCLIDQEAERERLRAAAAIVRRMRWHAFPGLSPKSVEVAPDTSHGWLCSYTPLPRHIDGNPICWPRRCKPPELIPWPSLARFGMFGAANFSMVHAMRPQI